MPKMEPLVNLSLNFGDNKHSLQELCRCCMTYTPKELQFLFNSSYSEIFTKTTSIQINKLDVLPKILCQPCATKLDSILDFVKQCLETDQKLKDLAKVVLNLPEVKHEEFDLDIKADHDIETNVTQFEDDASLASNDNKSDSQDKNLKASQFKKNQKRKNPEPKVQRTLRTKNCKKPKNFTCKICNFSCKSEEILEVHMIVHNETKKEFECKICSKSYKYEKSFTRHQMGHTKLENDKETILNNISAKSEDNFENTVEPELIKIIMKDKSKDFVDDAPSENTNSDNEDWVPIKTAKLEIKSEKTSNQKSTQKKKLKKGQAKYYKCFTCDELLDTLELLKSHYESNKGACQRRTYKCELCDYKSKSFSCLRVHMTKHSAPKRAFQCELCIKSYDRGRDLRRHLLRKHDIKVIYNREPVIKPINPVMIDENGSNVCRICKETFPILNLLKDHVKALHPETLPFMCDACGECYYRKSSLRHHIEQKHMPSSAPKETTLLDDPIQCEDCEKSFPTKKSYEYHRKRLHTEKSHLCTFCGKAFLSKTLLENHIMIHTGLKPYSCNICLKKFRLKKQLVTHFTLHTGDKPYPCNVCGRRFRVFTQLSCHKLTHTGERPHKCDMCEQSFAIRRNLIVHRRRHTGETPYKCPYCEKGFTNSSCRKVHVRRHHKEYFERFVAEQNALRFKIN